MAGRQVKLGSILHRGPSEHDAGTHRNKKKKQEKKADSDFAYSHETPRLCPTFISRLESQHSNAGLPAPFSHNETIPNVRAADARCEAKKTCLRISVLAQPRHADVCASANMH